MEYDLNELLGFGVGQVESYDGSTVFAIETPFCYFDGDPVTIFFQKYRESFFLFDEGLALFQSKIAGVPIEKKLYYYRKRAQTHKLSLGDDGEISALASVSSLKENFTALIHFILTLDREARQFLEEMPSETNLKEQIEMYYKLWKPGEVFENQPRVYVSKDLSCSFNMRFGHTFVDGITPKSEHTGQFLRKAAILRQSNLVEAEPLAIIDDSMNRDMAQRELGNISVLASGMLLSSLHHNATKSGSRLLI